MITIDSMQPKDALNVARLHLSTITGGFLGKLGVRFLAVMYRAIASDSASHVWVARNEQGHEQEPELAGFCAYTRDVGAMYRRLLPRHFVQFGFAALPRILNPWVVKDIMDTLRYPAKQDTPDLPRAEILSIGVAAIGRGKGVGRQLLEQGIAQARLDGEEKLKVAAGDALEGANRFYPACGFQKHAQILQHGEPLNIYVMHLK